MATVRFDARSERERLKAPDERAREDLVRWCYRHRLPVPPRREEEEVIARADEDGTDHDHELLAGAL